ncbi:MAG: DoxX family protein [Kofleriaceae bacterium]
MTLPRAIEHITARVEPHAWAALRVIAGVMFAFHGAQKMFGLFGKAAVTFGSQKWFGGIIELVCGLLIAVGLFTRSAAFLASGTMAVAYFQFHWKLQAGDRFWPIVNGGELAVVYCFLFLFIAARGAGRYSLDEYLVTRRT